MLNNGMYSSKTDLWSTPQDFYDELNREFGFVLDACALPCSAKCKSFFTPAQDGLRQDWASSTWCNPPYGREIGKWVRKARLEAERGNTVVCLLPARTDTRWFHDYVLGRAEIRFVRGHEAYSCDIQEPSGGHPEWHILGDALQAVEGGQVTTMDL